MTLPWISGKKQEASTWTNVPDVAFVLKNVRPRKNPNEFNRGLNNRSAIYTPFAQAIPNVPVIDREHCIKFKTGKCGVCSKVCAAGAIDYEQKDEIVTQKYGAIVVATGFDVIPLDKYDEYAYSQSKDVITSLELERIMNAAGPTKGSS